MTVAARAANDGAFLVEGGETAGTRGLVVAIIGLAREGDVMDSGSGVSELGEATFDRGGAIEHEGRRP